jgi:uncharacterized protein (UPF0335 family)
MPQNAHSFNTLGPEARNAVISYAQRIKRLQDEIAGLKDDLKSVKKEADSGGYSSAMILGALKVIEEDAVERYYRQTAEQDLYIDVLKDFATTPLGQAAARSEAA